MESPMRTRQRSTQLVYPSTSGTWKINNGSSPVVFNKSCLADNKEVMVDQVNPGYFPAAKLGKLLPVSPMSQSTTSTLIIPGSADFVADLDNGGPALIPNWYTMKCQGLFGSFDAANFSQPVPPEVNKDILVQGALASAQTNAFDKLTFAAEFHKTVEMFLTAQKRYSNHFSKVWAQAQRNANSNRSKHDRMIDFMTEAWFEWRFGLRPILYDIEAAQEMLRRLAEGSPILSRGWSSDEASASSNSSSRVNNSFEAYGFNGVSGTYAGGASTGGIVTEVARTWTKTVSGRAAVGVHVTTRDLTMADPVLTLWELTPMSVFIDYFVSIGDMLAAFSPFATGNLAFATYTRTVTDELVETARWRAMETPSLKWRGSCSPSTVVQTRVFKERVLVTPTPTLGISVQLDRSRVIDLLALSWALRRRLSALTRMLTRR